MHANVGDRILIGGRRVGLPQRNCEVLEVRRANGEPPYVVRWPTPATRTSSSRAPTRRWSARSTARPELPAAIDPGRRGLRSPDAVRPERQTATPSGAAGGRPARR